MYAARERMRTLMALLREYGPCFVICRGLYAVKLKLLKWFPASAALYERSVTVRRIDAFAFDLQALRVFLRALPPQARVAVTRRADDALAGRIDAFDALPLAYGQPVDWHFNPLTGQHTDKHKPWYEIPDFASQTGDIKVIWEPSRLTHFWHFARAYLLTGDEKYHAGFSQQLADWLAQNPYPYGANFKDGQECALRMINTLAAYAVFHAGGLTGEADERAVREMVRRCYKKIRSNFFNAYRCIHNNHTFTEICGQIIGAYCMENERLLARAYRMLEAEIRCQFFADGGYRQYSFNYQRFTLQVLLCVMKLAEKTGKSLSAEAADRVGRSVLLMHACQAEDGDVPNYGSNDGALIFPVTACGYRDYRPTLGALHARIAGKRLYAKGPWDEELLWFGGRMDAPLDTPERRAAAFSEAGLYTLRHPEGFVFIVLQHFATRPGHLDQLHLDLWHRGVNILCDGGTYSYAEALGRTLAQTEAHNTAKVAGLEQMRRHGAFLVTDWTQDKVVSHTQTSFAGTMVSRLGYTHRRLVQKAKGAYQITDVVMSGGRPFAIVFHTPLACRTEGKRVLLMDGEALFASILGPPGAAVSIEPSVRSLYYLQTGPTQCIRFAFSPESAGRPCPFRITLH